MGRDRSVHLSLVQYGKNGQNDPRAQNPPSAANIRQSLVKRSCAVQCLARALAVVAVAAGVSACASGPKAEKAAPVPEAQPEPPPPPPPPPPTKEEKAQAERLTVKDAVNALQNGDESGARAILERAQRLDPSNELARKLMDQINADAQKDLGPVFFNYTVQKDDSISKLAHQYLGDKYRFYILAKYNNMTNPSKLVFGQTIKIPGTKPKAPPPPAPGPKPEVQKSPPKVQEPAEAVEAPPKPAKPEPEPENTQRKTAEHMVKEGMAQKGDGNLEGAYNTFSEAARLDPANAEAARQRDATRRELLARYDREATAAFQRQNLDLAIKKWDQLLQLDQANQKARLERERALDLKARLEKFGTTEK